MTTAQWASIRVRPDARRRERIFGWLAIIGMALLAAGLFGRIMTFPLTHDEQLHIPAARLILREPLYGGLGYTHLPGLPLVLGGLYAASGTDHLLQAGRMLIALCWVATVVVLWFIARRHAGDGRLAVPAALVLAAGTLLGPTGMLVTNNFLPVPFALLGMHLFITALDGPDISGRRLIGAGLAIGFAIVLKISYVFLLPPVMAAVCVVPRGLSFGERTGRVLAPLLVGGVIGGLPALVVLASDPHMLFAHSIRYFTISHIAYWEHATAPKAMSLADKVLVAEDVWLAGGGLLAGLLVGTALWILGRQDAQALRWWPLPLVAGLVVLGGLGGFAPTPAFPQYYEPPVPFLILLFLMLYGRLEREAGGSLRPLFGTAAVLALAMILPRLLPGIPAAVQPSRWTGHVLHADGERLHAALAAAHRTGKVATLAPIVVLEGGLPIYPEFAAGPFVYRVADYLPATDRGAFTTTSPTNLTRFLDADPPAAIVTGREPDLDPAFVAYALSRGYRTVATGDPQSRWFIRP